MSRLREVGYISLQGITDQRLLPSQGDARFTMVRQIEITPRVFWSAGYWVLIVGAGSACCIRQPAIGRVSAPRDTTTLHGSVISRNAGPWRGARENGTATATVKA